MTMDSTFIRELRDTAPGEIKEIEGRSYLLSPRGLNGIQLPMPEPLGLTTLDGIIDYLNCNPDLLELGFLFIHVKSPTLVELCGALTNQWNQRARYLEASPVLPQHRFGSAMTSEQFSIYVQSRFVATEKRADLLKVAGNVRQDATVTVADDGTSQNTTARTGVAKVENVQLPNPVELQPFVTFPEVEQPIRQFVFRMREGPEFSLYEADEGSWQAGTIQTISDYLETALSNNGISKVQVIS